MHVLGPILLYNPLPEGHGAHFREQVAHHPWNELHVNGMGCMVFLFDPRRRESLVTRCIPRADVCVGSGAHALPVPP